MRRGRTVARAGKSLPDGWKRIIGCRLDSQLDDPKTAFVTLLWLKAEL